LLATARHLTGEARDTLIAEVFSGLVAATTVADRTDLLVEIAPELPPSITAIFLALADQTSGPDRVRLLRALAPILSEEQRSALAEGEFAAVQRSPSDELVKWVALFGDVLPRSVFDDAIDSIADASDLNFIVDALCSVAAACHDPTRRAGV